MVQLKRHQPDCNVVEGCEGEGVHTRARCATRPNEAALDFRHGLPAYAVKSSSRLCKGRERQEKPGTGVDFSVRGATMNFAELVGQKILVHTTISKLEEIIEFGSTATVELTGVESGGIWVTHAGLEEGLGRLAGVGGTMASLSNVQVQIFLPFSSIVFAAYRSPRLDERSLGLENPE
jgi:hypothetical protein